MTHRRLLLVLPLFVVLLFGCKNSPPFGNVSGTVKYKGSPVTGGSITFYASEGGVYPTLIKPDATYSISSLPAGDLVAVIETESVNPKNIVKADQYGAGQKGANRDSKDPKNQKTSPMPKDIDPAASAEPGKYVPIPAKYGKKETSNLPVTVTAGKQTYNFDLE